jgi:dipeptidyl aminopeptidase/acylaminoacyl peptidase
LARTWICAAVALAVSAAAAGSASASFPGRNGTIAYLWFGDSAYRAGPSETSIRTVDPRTRMVRVLRECPLRSDHGIAYTDCGVRAPAYSPDGSRLAFPTSKITPSFTGQAWLFEPGLATIAPDGSALEERSTAYDYFAAAWAPAGDGLLLERVAPGSSGNITVFASVDGTERGDVRQIAGFQADWSSRGEIAFVRSREGVCEAACEDIHVARLGGPSRRLTPRGIYPSWSPHGTRLAFARTGRTGTSIFVVRRDGENPRRVTRKGGGNLTWSPDGKWIAFTRNGDIFVIRPNGRDRRRLLNAPLNPDIGEGRQAASIDWQPLPGR